MVARVLVIGGYGNFGGYIARSLAADPAIRVVVAGRSAEKAARFAAALDAVHPAEGRAIDIAGDLRRALDRIAPDIVIHPPGPFQRQGYAVAEACVSRRCHYLDLADARAFVCGISALDAAARDAGVLVVSGASSVPCLTAAVIDEYAGDFAELRAVDYGISAAQQTNRGLATISAVLGYVGSPFEMLRDGRMTRVFGWQDSHSEIYPELDRRWFGNCDIPDLTLFPARYPTLGSMRFGAGHEIAVLHFGTWLLGWLVRLRLLPRLDRFARPLLALARLFDRFGSSRSGFHMFLRGAGEGGARKTVRFFLVARSGHGPYIPCMPAILLARKLARGEIDRRGATPCLDLIDLPAYLAALEGLDITVHVEGAG